LKAHQPPLPEFASQVAVLEGLTRIDVTVVEMDEKTESLKVIVDGKTIDFDKLREHLTGLGAVIHSVDKVVVELP